MVKQDRQGARTPEDLERKYKFAKNFAELKREIQLLHDKLDKVVSALEKNGVNNE